MDTRQAKNAYVESGCNKKSFPMTPLETLRLAELHFTSGESLYKFKIPPGKSWVNYTKRLRQLANKRGYHWCTAHIDKREWVIKRKQTK